MADLVEQPLVMEGEGWADYGLVDSGHGRKLERYGPYRFIRPEPQAMWSPRLGEWQADGEFIPGSDEDGGGRWHFDRPVPDDGWPLAWNEVPLHRADTRPSATSASSPTWPRCGTGCAESSPARGGGPHAVWWRGRAARGAMVANPLRQMLPHRPPPRHREGRGTLNLFGYTGVGTLALSECGPVTHVDASKKSVAQARENAALSGMEDRPIRWLVDDAAKFAAREVRRGNRYDGIILDPPKFGRGPKNETWRLEEGLPGLVADCRTLLDAESRFLFLTVYAVRMSSLALGGLLAEHFAALPGTIEHGDLAVREEGEGGRLLPTAIFARWRNS